MKKNVIISLLLAVILFFTLSFLAFAASPITIYDVNKSTIVCPLFDSDPITYQLFAHAHQGENYELYDTTHYLNLQIEPIDIRFSVLDDEMVEIARQTFPSDEIISDQNTAFTINWQDYDITIQSETDYTLQIEALGSIVGTFEVYGHNNGGYTDAHCAESPDPFNHKGIIRIIKLESGFIPFWISASIPTAYATTTCSFVTGGNTTTASCSDAVINNPTQDFATGLFLFFTVFFGLIFYMKGGDKE